MNESVLGNIGTNTVDAYEICQITVVVVMVVAIVPIFIIPKKKHKITVDK